MKKKYRCDICGSEGDSYYGYNSTYGYCNKKECQEEAKRRLKEDMMDQIATGRPDIAMELAGDDDPLELF